MKKASVLFLSLSFAVLSLQSCRELPTAPGVATIKGQVWTTQCSGSYDSSFSGITVSLDGTNVSSVTNDSGYYELYNVPSGTYNITFSKPGYGSVRWFGRSVQGGGNAPIYWDQFVDPLQSGPYCPQILYKQPDLVATLQSLSIVDSFDRQNNGSFLRATGTYSGSYPQLVPNMTDIDFAIYYSAHSDVSFLPGHYATFSCGNYALASPYWQIDTISKTFAITYPISGIEQKGHFASGDSIYVATYGAPYYQAGWVDYLDPETGNYVLTATNQTPSPVFGLKIP